MEATTLTIDNNTSMSFVMALIMDFYLAILVIKLNKLVILVVPFVLLSMVIPVKDQDGVMEKALSQIQKHLLTIVPVLKFVVTVTTTLNTLFLQLPVMMETLKVMMVAQIIVKLKKATIAT